ncbi:EAL domain-containing protein [Aeromonas intestinalis]
MKTTFSLLDLLAAWRERLFANRYLNAIIAAAIAVVPLQIIRGLTVAASLIYPNAALDNIQKGLVVVIPALINAFICLHWAAKNRLSFTHSLTIGVGTLLIMSCLINNTDDPLRHFTIPVTVLSALASCRLYELISRELNSRTSWVESSYRFLISISIYFTIVLMVGGLAGVAGRSFFAWFDALQLADMDLSLSPTYGHGLVHLLNYTLPWFFGLHGSIVFIGAEHSLSVMTHANLAAWAAGKAELNILSLQFFDVWCNVGGTGNTLSLAIAVMLKGDHRSRTLLPVSLPLAMLNINEPLIFGLPIVLNPLMLIPFILTPVTTYSLAYLATSLGWIPHLSSTVGWSVPVVLNSWIASGHSYAAVLFQLMMVALGGIIYYPFLTAGQHKVSTLGSVDNNSIIAPLENFCPVSRDMMPNYKNLEEEQAWRDANSSIDRLNASGTFVLFFQPQVCVHSGKIKGAEALLRFRTNGGNIQPPTFLKHYERLGLMSEVDFWVMQSTVNYIHDSLSEAKSLTISVNVSPQTLVDKRLFLVIDRILNRPLPKGCKLEFEITESQKVTDHEKVTRVLHELSKRGIRLALDDFGSGYSTLNYLTRYPLDKIKLDRSLVLGLVRPEGFKFLRQVVKLCELNRRALLIEGVETEAELKQVEAAGISLCQEFFFHRPMSGTDFCQLIVPSPRVVA